MESNRKKSEEPKESNYYAFVNAIEETNDYMHLELDCLGTKWVETSLFSEGFNILQLDNGFPSVLITVSIRKDLLPNIFKMTENLTEMSDSWLEVTLGDDGFVANFYSEYADYLYDPIFIKIQEFIRLKDKKTNVLSYLTKKISFEDIIEKCTMDVADIESFVKEKCKNNAEFVASYGVGQGSANAICDSNGFPLLYFDVGGGFGRNWFTYLRTKRFCTTNVKIVFLSHWDTDHYESADRNANLSLIENLFWIAPNQSEHIGPRNLTFAIKLFRQKKLILLPIGFGVLNTPYGRILECTGNNKNNKGIAYEIELSPNLNTIKNVLLPGDASYCNIPMSQGFLYDGIVATHHGANFQQPVTVPLNSNQHNAIVYSYGLGNIWQHPRNLTAINDHINGNWNNRRDISHSNIGIYDHPLNPILMLMPCNGLGCDLQIHQSFY